MRKALTGSIAALILVADLLSKAIVEAHIGLYTTVNVISSFNLVHIYNRGMSFGILASSSVHAPYILSFLGICIIAVLGRWLMKAETALQEIALASIIGGAASNIVDRLYDGAVTDFIDFYVGTYHWPAFNLADIAVVCGVAALMFDAFHFNGVRRSHI